MGQGMAPALIAGALSLSAPLLMGFQNFDDMSRRYLSGSRDFASNFLQSCDKNAIIFTYGDNDTYPLWYAQEVEGIRTDVRVVNLSLINVDWYIDQLRRKVNDSPALEFTLSSDALLGMRRNQVFVIPDAPKPEMNLKDVLRFIGEDHPLPLGSGKSTESYLPTTNFILPVDTSLVFKNGILDRKNARSILPAIHFNIDKNLSRGSLIKGDLAVLDIIGSNAWKRPIYFAITCRESSLMSLDKYFMMEGLGLKLVPVENPGERAYGIAGKGSVNTDKAFDIIMKKFRWGGFDKHEQFVDGSFGPSLQSLRFVFFRTVNSLISEKQNDKAIQLIDKYYESFPQMNFPIDYNSLQFANYYELAGAHEKAKKLLDDVVNETASRLNFYHALPIEKQDGLRQDINIWSQTMEESVRLARAFKDEAYLKSITDKYSKYRASDQEMQDVLEKEINSDSTK